MLEEEFIYAAEFGDIPTAQRILEENSNFSVDYSDILGRTPLRLAVGNEHLEVSNAIIIHNAYMHSRLDPPQLILQEMQMIVALAHSSRLDFVAIER